LAHREHEPLWRPLALAFESSILEEITFGLFALSVLTWIASRLTSHRLTAFRVGWLGSTLLFGLAHIPAWFSATTAGPLLFALVLLVNGAAGCS
jgi:Type II CAAX prenyl endopeptidase Rce1-like